MQTGFGSKIQLGDLGWFCIKISFAWFWFRTILRMLEFGGKCPYPVGICNLYSFDPLFTAPGVWFLAILLLVCIVLYLSEKQMLFATGMLTLLSAIIISHHESNGIYLRATPYTTIFGAQFIAYLIAKLQPRFNLSYYRQQYVVQIIAATYTLAAISKLSASGIGWIDSGTDLFPIQAMRGFSFRYFSTGDISVLQKGYEVSAFMIEHKWLLKLLLGSSLLLEMFCLLATLHPRIRFGYGLALAMMHIGIYYYMDILIAGLALPMAIFFINPLYLIVLAFKNRAWLLRSKSEL